MKTPSICSFFCLLFAVAATMQTCGSEIREGSCIRQFAGNIGRLPVQSTQPTSISWDAASAIAARQVLGPDYEKRLVAMGYQSPVEFALHVAIHPSQTDLIPWFSLSLQLSARLGLAGRYASRTYAELEEHREFIHSVASIHPLDVSTMPPGWRHEIQDLDRGLQAYRALRSLFQAAQGASSLALRFTEEMAIEEPPGSDGIPAQGLIQPSGIPTEAAFVWSVVPVLADEANIVDWITLEEALTHGRQGNLLSPVAMAYAELFDGLKSEQAPETLKSIKTLMEIPVIRSLLQEADPAPPSQFPYVTLIPGILACTLCLVAVGLFPWVWKRRYQAVRAAETLLTLALLLKGIWLLGSGMGAIAGWFWQAGALLHSWGACLWMSRRETDLRLRLPGMILATLPILFVWPQIQPDVVIWTMDSFPFLWLAALSGWILGSVTLSGLSLYFFLHKAMTLIQRRSAALAQKQKPNAENPREDLRPVRWILILTLATTGMGLLLLQFSHAHPAGWVFPIACLLACACTSAFLLQLAWIRLLSSGVMLRGLLVILFFSVALATAPLPVAADWLPPHFLAPSQAHLAYQWILGAIPAWILVELFLMGWKAGLRLGHRPKKQGLKKPGSTANQRTPIRRTSR